MLILFLSLACSAIDLILERLCLEGSRRQAKYAVHALATITKDDGLKSLSVLYKVPFLSLLVSASIIIVMNVVTTVIRILECFICMLIPAFMVFLSQFAETR